MTAALEAELAADADQLEPVEVLAARELKALGFSAEVVEALAQPLDLTRVKKKPGTKFDYIGHADIRRTLNRIFGYGGWGYTTDSVNLVSQGPLVKDGREGFQACAIATVTLKLRLADGTWLEKGGTGEGTGNGYGPTAPVEAPGKAAKEAESDALKRAAVNLGDQFGLILYAKEEREALQAEAVYNAPVSTEDVKQLGTVATLKGKQVEYAKLVEDEYRDFGHVRAGRFQAIKAKLAALPDAAAPAAEPKPAPVEQTDTAEQKADDKPAALALPEGDREASEQDVKDLMALAVKLGPPGLRSVTEAVGAQRQKYGGRVSGAWLASQSKRIIDRLNEAAAEVNGERTAEGPEPGDVAEAFGVGAEKAAA